MLAWQNSVDSIAKVFAVRTTRVQKSFVTCVLTCLVVITYFATVHITRTTDLSSAPALRRSRCSYVGFQIPTTGNGLGNHLFYYTGVMYVASLTGRRPCIWTNSTNTLLDRVFDVDIERVDIKALACPVHKFTQLKIGVYDRRVESLVNTSHNESLLVKGSFLSWKYTQPIAEQLRRQLAFRRELVKFVAEFWANRVPPSWNGLEFVRAGTGWSSSESDCQS